MERQTDMSDVRREFQVFYTSEFQAEEGWLNYMHSQGWKLQSINILGNYYTFERCTPEDWIYQLDFKENGIAEADYLQLYADYGWEFLFRFRHWFYFRKKRVEGAQEDMSIFSDNESRIAMCRRIIRFHFLLLLSIWILFAACTAIVFLAPLDPSDVAFLRRIAVCIFLFASISLGVQANQIYRLKHIVRNMENPMP